MTRRQMVLFKIGCWVAIATAAAHMAGQLAGPPPPANDTERTLLDLATNYRIAMPGGSERSLMDFLSGFSLTFAVFTALIGGTGLIVAKRGREDAVLMQGVARANALAGLVLLAIALTHFFIVPTIFIAAMTLCFAVAAVRAQG
jgi:hypothetical protein